MGHLDGRDLLDSLVSWTQHGLIGVEQADAIAAHEGIDRTAPAPPPRGVSGGILLQYAGSLVALGAVLGLYLTVFDDMSDWARLGVMIVVAAGWTGLAWFLARAAGGAAAGDALGFSAAVLWYATSLQVFSTLGWLSGDPTPGELRAAFFFSSAVGAGVSYLMARGLPSPLAAVGVPIAVAWGIGVFGWWVGNPASDNPGAAGAQVMVVLGLALAALAVTEGTLQLDRSARIWWQIGALGVANVAGVILAVSQGGAYEGLLFAYAVGLAGAAIGARQRVAVVFAALMLYEYIGIVVFRTFEGAMGAIIILALIGLGTALGGTAAQRGGLRRLRLWR